MRLPRSINRLSRLNPKVEFSLLLGWLLFFPLKDSPLYFPTFAFLVLLVSFRGICFMKNLSLSSFSYSLLAFNLLIIISVLFAIYRYSSIQWIAGIFLVSCYFILFFLDKNSEDDYFHILIYIISAVSLFQVINFIVPGIDRRNFIFPNPIFQGVASGIAVVAVVYYLLLIPQKNVQKEQGFETLSSRIKTPGRGVVQRGLGRRPNWILFGLLVLNVAGVYVSESKAAFIGTAGICLLMVLLMPQKSLQKKQEFETLSSKKEKSVAVQRGLGRRPMKKKRLIPVTVGLIVLTFIIPNPIRNMFIFSIKKDPYAANRLDMWKMSLNIYKDHFFLGVGPDNFPEVSGKYNFKQTHGPANYFKRPLSPHSDYFKLLTETGSAGLIFLLFFGFVLIRRIISVSFSNLSTILILYLLFQALVFDIIFHLFFFFIFLFLLKCLFERQLIYKNFRLPLKVYCSFLLIFAFTAGYLLPYVSHLFMEKSQKTTDIVAGFNLLGRAEYMAPLDAKVHYLKALSLYHYFRKTTNFESFYSALEQLKKAQRLNPYFINTYWLESDLYLHLLEENVNYSGLSEEITAPLTTAEQYAPLNPFLKLRKADIYLRFDLKEDARQEALKALELEPDYAAALFFMQRNFNYFPNEGDFEKRIACIREKAGQYQSEPGTYLYKLFEIPGPLEIGEKPGRGEKI